MTYDNDEDEDNWEDFDTEENNLNDYMNSLSNNIKPNLWTWIKLPIIKNLYFFIGNSDSHAVWKTKYFIERSLDIAYRNHIKANSRYIVTQPSYYKGMFDIMN